jgi:DnaK suppressor protein
VTDLDPDVPRDVPAPLGADATEVRAALEQEREHLGGQLGELGRGEGSLDFDDNFADSGQVAAEQGENRVLASQLREQLDDVERALAKLDDGTYGACEVCGAAIGDSRLEAMPAARFCIDHAG